MGNETMFRIQVYTDYWITSNLSQAILTILVQVGEVDLITEQYHPLAQLYWGHDHSIGGPAILTVVVEGLEEKLRGGSTGEVKTNNLRTERKKKQQTSK